jgi:hypothetical protein
MAMSESELILNSFGRDDSHYDSPRLKRRRTWLGLGLSVFIHVLFFFFAIWRGVANQGDPVRSADEPLVVHLLPNAALQKASSPQAVSKPKPLPEHSRSAVIAVPKPTVQPLPIIVEERTVPAPEQAPPIDMMAMNEAAQRCQQCGGCL